MDCTKIRKKLNRYSDNELKESEKAVFLDHIDNCPNCQNELNQLRDLNSELADYTEIALSEETETRILSYIHKKKLPKRSLRPLALKLATGFSFVLAGILSFYIGLIISLDRYPDNPDIAYSFAEETLYTYMELSYYEE